VEEHVAKDSKKKTTAERPGPPALRVLRKGTRRWAREAGALGKTLVRPTPGDTLEKNGTKGKQKRDRWVKKDKGTKNRQIAVWGEKKKHNTTKKQREGIEGHGGVQAKKRFSLGRLSKGQRV